MKSSMLEQMKKIGVGKILLLAVCGGVLIFFSIPQNSAVSTIRTEEETTDPVVDSGYAQYLENRLSGLLGQMEGIGSVEVFVTLESSSRRVVNKDATSEKEEISETDGAGGDKNSVSDHHLEETILTGSGQQPYVLVEYYPRVEGVVVAAEGVDSVSEISEITEAVQALFGIEAHKIKVLKKIADVEE